MTFNISIILQLVLSVSLIISWYKRSKSLKKIIKKFILCIKKKLQRGRSSLVGLAAKNTLPEREKKIHWVNGLQGELPEGK